MIPLDFGMLGSKLRWGWAFPNPCPTPKPPALLSRYCHNSTQELLPAQPCHTEFPVFPSEIPGAVGPAQISRIPHIHRALLQPGVREWEQPGWDWDNLPKFGMLRMGMSSGVTASPGHQSLWE